MIGFGRGAVLLVGGSVLLANASGDQIVTTRSGKVEGATASGITIFRGIPYAAPPKGALRWRAPKPVAAWSAVRPALTFGPACPQVLVAPTQLSPLGPTAEDCLTLNIWVPSDHKRGHPVMLWLHGGGFIAGAGSEAQFDGAAFARRGIVLVSINYRLGRLGFFAHPALSREAGNTLQGNYWLLDQIAALRWVKANINAFGGNAGNVTIFGESAGGISVASLLTVSMARGLFHKAIIESGAFFPPPLNLATASRTGADWARAHGIEGSDSTAMARLRALPVEQIAPGAPRLSDVMAQMATSRPMIDGKLLERPVEQAFIVGTHTKVPLIIGSNALETQIWSFEPGKLSLLPIAECDPEAFLKTLPDGVAVANAYAADADGSRGKGLMRLQSDVFLGAPTRWLAEHAAKVMPTYLYRFDAMPASARGVAPGAPHGTEIFYVFGTLDRFPHNPDQVSDADRAVSAQLTDYWANFARTGIPSARGAPPWPRYERGGQLLLVTDQRASVVPVPHLPVLMQAAPPGKRR